MIEFIENMRLRTRLLARERRLSELSRVPGAPPYRTLNHFNSGNDVGARTLLRIQTALANLPDQRR